MSSEDNEPTSVDVKAGILVTTASGPSRRPPGKRQLRFPELVTVREDRFANLVALGLPLSRAYELVGFAASPRSRRANACRLAVKPNVAQLIRELSLKRKERLNELGEEELELLGDVMRFTVLDLFDDDGQPIRLQDLPRRVAAGIKGVRSTKHGQELLFRDTIRAAEVRLRAFGRTKETVKTGTSLEELVAGLMPGDAAGTPEGR